MVPVSERIAEEVFKRVQKLHADYSENTPVSGVMRITAEDDLSPRDKWIVMHVEDPEIDDELSHPGNPPATAWRLVVKLTYYVMPSSLDTTPLDTYRQYALADMRKVICGVGVTWRTWNGLAIDTRFLSPVKIASTGEGLAGVSFPISILYRTDQDNPYTVRA
jgi:hypothetical protein